MPSKHVIGKALIKHNCFSKTVLAAIKNSVPKTQPLKLFPKAHFMTSLPLTPIQFSMPFTSVQSQDSLHWRSCLQVWTGSPEVLSPCLSHTYTYTHKRLPHLADPSLYWRETLSLALKQLHCNYRHLSSVCLIYSQLKIPQKVAVGPVVCGPCD